MQLAGLTQEITVSGSEGQVSTDIAENLDVVKLDLQTLNSLPILGNDIVGAVTNMMGPAALGSGGAVLIVDGLPASELGLPAAAVQEVKINQDPYSAEFGSPGQNRIQITTKTGSQQYHGSFDTRFRDYYLDARNAFAASRPPEQHLDFDASLTGPLGKRTTFLINAERDQDNLQAIVYALVPSGIFTQNVATPYRNTFLSAVMNRQIGQSNVMSIRYSFYNFSYNGKGLGGATLPEASTDFSSLTHYLFLTDRGLITDHLINELSVRLVSSDSVTQSALRGQPSIVVLGAFTGGGAQQDRHQTQNYLQVTDMLSWSRDRHLVKAGVNIPSLDRWGLNDRSNFGGTFQFSSLQDYLQGTPFSFVQLQGNSRLVYWQKEVGAFAQDEVRVRSDLSVAFGLRWDYQNYVSNLKNFAPRLSFAFAPGNGRKTVFRGGAGVFYQTTGASAIADVLRFNGQTLQQFVLSNPGYPDPFGSGGIAQAVPSSIVRFAPDFRLPYVVQYSFGVERELSKSNTFTATYTGMRGFHLFESRDINAPLAPLYVQRPDPSIGMLREIESAGRLQSNTLNVSISTKIGHVFDGKVQYALGRSYDNTNGINWFPANQYDLTGEWARSNFDVRHTFRFYGTFDVGKLFKLGANLSVRSGMPYTETTGTDIYSTTFSNARPPGVSRNSLQGPGALTLDVRLAREFALHSHQRKEKEGASLTLGLDAFNVLNHVNFGQPVGDLTSPFFGQSIDAGPARRLQISLGLQF